MLPLTVTIKDAATTLGIGRTKLYQLANSGRLKLIKIDRRSLITTESIRSLLAELCDSENVSEQKTAALTAEQMPVSK